VMVTAYGLKVKVSSVLNGSNTSGSEGISDQLASFSALTLLVIWPVKIVPKMTYKVSSETLSRYSLTAHRL